MVHKTLSTFALACIITLCVLVVTTSAKNDTEQSSKTDDVNTAELPEIQIVVKKYPRERDGTKRQNNLKIDTKTESIFQNSFGKVSNIVKSVSNYITNSKKTATLEETLANNDNQGPAVQISDVAVVTDGDKNKNRDDKNTNEVVFDLDDSDDSVKAEPKTVSSKKKKKLKTADKARSSHPSRKSDLKKPKESPSYSNIIPTALNVEDLMQADRPRRQLWPWGSGGDDGDDDDDDDEPDDVTMLDGSGEASTILSSTAYTSRLPKTTSSIPPFPPSTTTTTISTEAATFTTPKTATSSLVSVTSTPREATGVEPLNKSTTQLPPITSTFTADTTQPFGGRGSQAGRSYPWNRYAPSDFENKAISNLMAYYETCDSCMTSVYNNSQQCPYYITPAKEVEEWARELSDVLRYGCPGQGVTQDYRCCHGPNRIVLDTISEMTKLTRIVKSTLTSQCDKCPVDCQWSSWGSWSSCPSECQPVNNFENHVSYRVRTRRQLGHRYRGRPCRESDEERELCPRKPRVIGTWLSWFSWSECSSPCGGVRHRTRKCSDPTECFTPCVGDTFEIQNCGDGQPCCRLREWASWSDWTSCTEVYPQTHTSERIRWRSCEGQSQYPGQPLCPEPCIGEPIQRSDCCHPSSWGPWSEWTPCTSSIDQLDLDTGEHCGKGCRNRTRECIPGNCNDDDSCKGDHIEYHYCNLDPCCKLPEWSQWHEWEPCSVSIGQGTQRRRRRCQPSPENWGSPTCKKGGCNELGQRYNDSMSRVCQGACPKCIPPTWETWGSWGPCDFSMNPPKKRRTRLCKNLSPYDLTCRYQTCPGSDTDYEDCDCVPPVWGTWSNWGRCDFTLNPPQRRRTRRCENNFILNPDCREQTCEGNSFDIQQCVCEPPLIQWGPWGPCEVHLDPPSKTRHRICTEYRDNPQYCRQETAYTCPREKIGEKKVCCYPPPSWSQWEQWSRCNQNRRPPIRTRTRRCVLPRSSYNDPVCLEARCPGPQSQEQVCNYPPTPTPTPADLTKPACDPGTWSEWSPWTNCDCQRQVQTRYKQRVSSPFLLGRSLCLPHLDEERRRCSVECNGCQESCIGRKDGKYPSCEKGCTHFIVCCEGRPIPSECTGDQQYDSLCRTCVRRPSPTCRNGEFDVYVKSTTIPTKTRRECSLSSQAYRRQRRLRRMKNS